MALQTLILNITNTLLSTFHATPCRRAGGVHCRGSPVSGRPAVVVVGAEHSPGRASSAVRTAPPQLPVALLEQETLNVC